MLKRNFSWSDEGLDEIDELLSYINKNVVIGLELELDFKNSESRDIDYQEIFGVSPTNYHELPRCQTCGLYECFQHIPQNLIRAIERDSSIEGYEFIIYGNNLSSKEFIKRLPLDQLRRYFKVTFRNSCHIHILIPNQIKPLPLIILKNLWQIYRYYYPAICYLTGSTYGKVIRNSHYATWRSFNVSAITDFESCIHGDRAGLYYGNCTFDNNQCIFLNVEMRTPDSTLNPLKLILLRALGKALLLRAVELSKWGVFNVDYDQNKWLAIKEIARNINDHIDISEDRLQFMKELSIELYHDLAQFLDQLERKAFKEIIEKPEFLNRRNKYREIRDNDPKENSIKSKLENIIKAKYLICCNSPSQWKNEIAQFLNTTPSFIAKCLSSMNVMWDKELGTYIWIYE